MTGVAIRFGEEAVCGCQFTPPIRVAGAASFAGSAESGKVNSGEIN
jgi:hypothetical protein